MSKIYGEDYIIRITSIQEMSIVGMFDSEEDMLNNATQSIGEYINMNQGEITVEIAPSFEELSAPLGVGEMCKILRDIEKQYKLEEGELDSFILNKEENE